MSNSFPVAIVITLLAIVTEVVAKEPVEVPENRTKSENFSRDESAIQFWIRQIRSIGPEGSGSTNARQAIAQLSTLPPSQIPTLLDAFTDANPLARNLLRGVIESIADRKTESLPISELVELIKHPQQHDPFARGLAFELLRRADPQRAKKIAPSLLHDPNPDLRRLAVARAIADAESLADRGQHSRAADAYHRALSGAIDRDQVTAIREALQRHDIAVDLPRHFGFITNWRIIGPFDNTNYAGFDQTYPPEKEYDPTAHYRGKLGVLAWQSLATDDDFGVVDIAKSLENYKGSVMYLVATFHADRLGDAEIRLGTQNAWKLWLNGEFLFGHEEYHRGMIMDQHRLPIHLKAGGNRILLKLLQDEQLDEFSQSYGFQLRITDETGTALHSTLATAPVLAPKP